MEELKTLKDLTYFEDPHFQRIYMKEKIIAKTMKEYVDKFDEPEFIKKPIKVIDERVKQKELFAFN
jgi:hypothetical protein